MFTEEQKFSCAMAELIHGLGNLLGDEKILIGELTANDGKLLQKVNPSGNYQRLQWLVSGQVL